MSVITLIAHRPASARTTSALHLAQAISLMGLKTLLVDCTVSAQLSKLFGVEREDGNLTSQAFVNSFGNINRISANIIAADLRPGVDLIPAHSTSSSSTAGDSSLDTKRLSDEAKIMLIERVSTALHLLSRRYDLVIIDTEDQTDLLTQAAIQAASMLVAPIPLQPGFAAAAELLERIPLHDRLKWALLLPTFNTPPSGNTAITTIRSETAILADRLQLVNERIARRAANATQSKSLQPKAIWRLLSSEIPLVSSVSGLAKLHLSAFDLGNNVLSPEVLATLSASRERNEADLQDLCAQLSTDEIRELARAYMAAAEELLSIMEKAAQAPGRKAERLVAGLD